MLSLSGSCTADASATPTASATSGSGNPAIRRRRSVCTRARSAMVHILPAGCARAVSRGRSASAGSGGRLRRAEPALTGSLP